MERLVALAVIPWCLAASTGWAYAVAGHELYRWVRR